MTFLTELKARPEEERHAFAVTVAISVVALLMVIWVVTIFVRANSLAQDKDTRSQTAAAASGLEQVVDKTSDAINAVSAQYKELQGKTASAAANARQVGYATSTIEDATKNFMKIRYDENGKMYIEQDDTKSLLDETSKDIPEVLDFPY